MPLPEDEVELGRACSSCSPPSRGDVRRNRLADFVNVKANGKIAMKLANGERLIGVQTCSEDEDVLLASALGGRRSAFAVADVRVFKGRTSTGVRGIKLAEGDEVISMSILRHVEAHDPRARGLCPPAPMRALGVRRRRGAGRGRGGARRPTRDEADGRGAVGALSDERFAGAGRRARSSS